MNLQENIERIHEIMGGVINEQSESKKEALNKDDNIDAAALSKEIGGDQIVKEVNEGSADDDNLVQINSNLNFDNQKLI
jgi:hypothetical protein